MLYLNFLYLKLCFHFNELRIFQCPSFLYFYVKCYCILCPPFCPTSTAWSENFAVSVHSSQTDPVRAYVGFLLYRVSIFWFHTVLEPDTRELRDLVPGTIEPSKSICRMFLGNCVQSYRIFFFFNLLQRRISHTIFFL